MKYLREGRWLQGAFPLSNTLRGRSVGIFGLGEIGKLIASRCEAFGMPVAYHGRHARPDAPYLYCASLLAMATDVDTLIVAAPGGVSPRNAVNRDVLRALGATAS